MRGSCPAFSSLAPRPPIWYLKLYKQLVIIQFSKPWSAAMRVTVLISLLVITIGGCLQPQKTPRYETFQLVYHSDTRGFYNPCG